MSIIVDLVILGILILCIFSGYRKGLTGSLLKIVSFLLAVIIAFVLFKPVSNFIISNTNWDENLEQGIRNTVMSDEKSQTTQGENQNAPSVLIDYINNAVEEAGDAAKEDIVNATARNVSITIINAGVWICLFIIARIILVFIKGLANLITKLPVIKQFDNLGGIIYGVLEALIIIYGILAIISFISPLVSNLGIISAIQKSFIGNIMYNNNLLLKLIF